MKKASLLRDTAPDQASVLGALRALYASQISAELNRLLHGADREMIERVLQKVYDRLPELPHHCDVSCLVFDCVRQEAVDTCRSRPALCRSAMLKEAAAPWPETVPPEQVLASLTGEQRKYFLDRYYYLREETPFCPGWEQTAARQLRGEGPAGNIPWAAWFARLTPATLHRLTGGETEAEDTRSESTDLRQRIRARYLRIAKYSIPISCALLLLMLLLIYFFPPF